MPLLVASLGLPVAEYIPTSLVGATFSRRYKKIVLGKRGNILVTLTSFSNNHLSLLR